MSNDEMSISAFSRRSLLSIKALRIYDESGLLRPHRVKGNSGYRYYSEDQLETARLISLLRKLDMPLAEIRNLLDSPVGDSGDALAAWWQHEEERMDARRDLLRYIQTRHLGVGEETPHPTGGYKFAIREMAESTWLYTSKRVHGPQLPAYIGESVRALMKRADLYGGSTGAHAVVFHGTVDLDSDGPADVCVPIASGSVAKGDDLIRIESAHAQAFTTLKKHQVAFPQVLQVYAALRTWIDSSGYSVAGPPRELYLDDFVEAKHDELICDIAIPVIKNEGTME